MRPLQEEKALLGGPEYGIRKILASRAGQKKWNWILKDQDILWPLKVSIKAVDIIRGHSLVLEPLIEINIKILKTIFQKMKASKN